MVPWQLAEQAAMKHMNIDKESKKIVYRKLSTFHTCYYISMHFIWGLLGVVHCSDYTTSLFKAPNEDYLYFTLRTNLTKLKDL